jgi:methylenetetrahydrofolate dehydrogenase (NADP+)/methenyltetrahydrofolate cyclohydrolase
MELLRRHGVALEGAEAVVVGRSDLVGKPVAALLLAANATVTTCHSRTRDLPAVCRRADVLIAAVGRPEMVRGDWIKQGAVVVDVGINRTETGIVGDVDFAGAAERARLITPVPGGVGPMTIAMLLRNTLEAARAQAGVLA